MASSAAKKFEIEMRRDDIMRRMALGQPTSEIAGDLGVSETTVNSDIKARLLDNARGDENTKEYRSKEGRALDTEIAKLAAAAFSDTSLLDLKAAALLLKFRERYHKLFGLDIAVKQIIQYKDPEEDRPIDGGMMQQFATDPVIGPMLREINRQIERKQLEAMDRGETLAAE